MNQAEDRQFKSTQPRILLWGGRSQGRILDEMVRELNLGKVELLFDPSLSEPQFSTDARFLSHAPDLRESLGSVTHFVLAIGAEHGFARCATSEVLRRLGLKPLSAIHPRAFVEPTASVGQGLQAMPFALVHKFASVGDDVILNSHALVEHECIVGDGVHLMPGAKVTGRVRIDNYAVIGSGATVLPDLHLGEGAFVAAGAVVTRDVAPHSLVAGCPARHVRFLEPSLMGEALTALEP